MTDRFTVDDDSDPSCSGRFFTCACRHCRAGRETLDAIDDEEEQFRDDAVDYGQTTITCGWRMRGQIDPPKQPGPIRRWWNRARGK